MEGAVTEAQEDRMRALLLVTWIAGCGGNDVQGTGQACAHTSDCYANIDGGVPGTPLCLDVSGGYCTHTCASDAECCSVPGECDFGDRGELVQVCAPFESLGGTWCFLSCEDAILATLPEEQRATFCEDTSPDLHCRATGGGDPKKVCLPSG
jgi:hypothetical protein